MDECILSAMFGWVGGKGGIDTCALAIIVHFFLVRALLITNAYAYSLVIGTHTAWCTDHVVHGLGTCAAETSAEPVMLRTAL
jgi:hypothetical protein